MYNAAENAEVYPRHCYVKYLCKVVHIKNGILGFCCEYVEKVPIMEGGWIFKFTPVPTGISKKSSPYLYLPMYILLGDPP